MTQPTRQVRRTGRPMLARVLGVILAVGLGVFAVPAPAAQAHATLLFTSPAVDGAVPTSPEQILLVFDQAVVPARAPVTVTGRDGDSVALGSASTGSEGRTVSVPVRGTLEEGEYLVRWQATAADGDTMLGEFRFAVGSTAGLSLAGGGPATTRGAPLVTGLRWALFLGLSLTLGGLVGARLARRTRTRTTIHASEPEAEPAPWVGPGLWLGLGAAVGLALLYLGDGSLRASLDRISIEPFLTAAPGRLAALEVLALTTALILKAVRRPAWSAVPAVGVAVLEGFRAHPQTAAPGWGATLIAVHLLAAAVWVGALIHVLRVARWRHTHGQPAAPLVRAYARLALILFLVVLAAGTVSALTLIDLNQLIGVLRDTGYGHWLLAKLTLLTLVAGLAAWARWHLAQHPDRRQPASAARVEAVTLVAILGISGALTALAPPAETDIALPFPPPAVGPVEALGSRAGWIGVGVSASSGQLLVRLTTPDTHNELEARDSESYSLAGNITDASADGAATNGAVKLAFRRCGTGCFVAPVDWTNGHHTLTLKTSSQRFEGGTTALTVVWPAEQDPAQLRRVVHAMRTVEHLTVHEQVTSDTNAGLGDPNTFVMNGRKFLSVGPYGSGIASTVVVLKHTTAETTLALGYPAEGTYLLLTIDQQDRIIHEVQSAPNHLVTRTLVYPEPDHEDEHDH